MSTCSASPLEEFKKKNPCKSPTAAQRVVYNTAGPCEQWTSALWIPLIHKGLKQPTRCIGGYFSIAMTKHYEQGNLQKENVIFGPTDPER